MEQPRSSAASHPLSRGCQVGVHQDKSRIRLAVVIATKNRSATLANRALASVVTQTRQPDYLVVVDDSDRRFVPDNRRIVASIDLPDTCVVYRKNDRTPGACGAWNAAIDWLHRQEVEMDRVFVAILDDDDAWTPFYLAQCAAVTQEGRADMVAAGIRRLGDLSDPPTDIVPPASLSAEAFLVGNPGIQGSNLFVRLSILLAAGLFDESLPSTTDRDLCIRIADLPRVEYRRIPDLLVDHYAENGRPRLTTAGSAAKNRGLDGFWRKYASRMNSEQRAAFTERARRLFDWNGDQMGTSRDHTPWVAKRCDRETQPVTVVVGIVVDVSRPERTESLIKDLVTLSTESSVAGVTVVMLENGSPPTHVPDRFDPVRALKESQMGCFVIPIERQREDARAGLFGEPFERRDGMVSIATARTMLQTYVYLVAKPRTGSIAWILDGDVRLENLVCNGSGTIRVKAGGFGELMARLKAAGHDIALGTVTDAPPVPFASCVRTQLVDLLHNLFAMAALNPLDAWPNRHGENMSVRARCDDYYYDLSRRDTDHLETPFWFVPTEPAATVEVAFREMVSRLPRILAGEQVFRPLVLESQASPVDLAKPSVHRGGNTFVFDIEALRDFPNAAPTVAGSETRRSDMVWSLLNRYVARRSVVKVPVGVRQDRTDEPVGKLDLCKLARDIQGYALYSALEDLLLDQHERAQGSSTDPAGGLDEIRPEALFERMGKYFRERLAAFSLSFHRAAGIAAGLGRFIGEEEGSEPWWLQDNHFAESVEQLEAFIAHLRTEYDPAQLAGFERTVADVDLGTVERFLDRLRADVGARSRPSPAVDDAMRWMNLQRVATAERQVRCSFEVGDLRLLGMGAEAVVLTNGRQVFKCIDYWKSRRPDARLDFLREQVGRWKGRPGLYDLRTVRKAGTFVLITYDFEASTPYRGGHGASLVRLLQSCRDADIVCSNIHPDNLIVTSDGVKLIDYGSDVRPYSEEGFAHMARRAFLSWRFAGKEDLKELMTRSLHELDMPELEGFHRFWLALAPATKERLVDDRVLALLGQGRGRSLLDYGCGKAKLASSLGASGWTVTGFDPDERVASDWTRSSNGARLGGGPLLHQLRETRPQFDAVVCSLVLCLLDDREFDAVLSDIRLFTRPGARAIVAVCNPRYIDGTTQLQKRSPPSGATSDGVFRLEKTVFSSGRRLVDVHRPLRDYLGQFKRAGFVLNAVEETPAIDVETFDESSDFMIFDMTRAVGGEDGGHAFEG